MADGRFQLVGTARQRRNLSRQNGHSSAKELFRSGLTSKSWQTSRLLKSPKGHYSRLCPGEWAPHPEEKLGELAWIMRDSKGKCAARKRTLAMPSGYIYLGQFIGHDLTRDTRSLAESHLGDDQMLIVPGSWPPGRGVMI